jgi:hypothetical protein
MHKKVISTICLMSVFLLITIFPGAMPAWSAPGDKKQIRQESPDKSILDLEETKQTKPGKKGEKSVKKKVVKKAGAAAAVGVVGKKATSGVKKGLK